MDFRKALEMLINAYCQENGSNTPDFILASYLTNCLMAYDTAVNAREKWHSGKALAPLKIWTCKIGEVVDVPHGADGPMRDAVERAYMEITGKRPEFCFSGWGGELTQVERDVVNDQVQNVISIHGP